MGLFLSAVLLCQAEPFHIEGPPFLVLGESAEFRLIGIPKDAVPVFRIGVAPGGISEALTSTPAFDPRGFVVRGSPKIELQSKGDLAGDVHLFAWLDQGGQRVAAAEFRLRLGPLLRVKVWCKTVAHSRGGTEHPELFENSASRTQLQADVNRRLRPLGIEVLLAAGKRVAAPEAWFDPEGRFHPVVEKEGIKERSPTLRELLKHNEPGGLNVYLLRESTWDQVRETFERTVTHHPLRGVGFKEGDLVLSDSADAADFAHELGHAFALEDQKDKSQRGRLMYWIRKERTGESFTEQEMKDARERAKLHLKTQVP